MGSFYKVSLLVLFILSAAQLNMQAQTNRSSVNFPSVYYSPSPRINALGMAGSSLPTDDPYGFYYNPAQLGYFSQTNNLSYQLYPSNVDWGGFNQANFRNSAVNIGYNFKNLLGGLSLSAGFGYIHSKLDFGTVPVTTADSPDITLFSYSIYDEYDAYSVGIGIDYYVEFNVGITYKKILSGLFSSSPQGLNTYTNPSAMDYGLLLTVPVVKLIKPEYKFNMIEGVAAAPYFNISIGYSRLNQGGEAAINIDPTASTPLPRDSRLGYALSAGLNIKLSGKPFKLFSHDFTADAEEVMVNAYQIPTNNNYLIKTFSYKDGLGDIQLGNLFGVKGDDNVTMHKAHEFNLFESFSVMIGRFDGGGYHNEESNGIGMRVKGLLNLLKAYTSNETFNFIADHIDVQYYSSTINIEWQKFKYESVNISFYNFEF